MTDVLTCQVAGCHRRTLVVVYAAVAGPDGTRTVGQALASLCVEHARQVGTIQADGESYVVDFDRATGWRLVAPPVGDLLILYPPGVLAPDAC